jgi:hypothetical protein
MVVTLLVRHLPDGLPPHTLTRLFTHYGASETRPCAGGRCVRISLCCFYRLATLLFVSSCLVIGRVSFP